MPKTHNLYQFMFNTGYWKRSSAVTLMTSSQRGIYIELLCSAWILEGSGLPIDEISLKKLARPDSDAQWATDWPIVREQFLTKAEILHLAEKLGEGEDKIKWIKSELPNDRLYNPRQVDLFRKSLLRYKSSILNSTKPPKEGKLPRGRPKENLKENLDNNLDNNPDPKLQKTQPTTYNLQPTDHSVQTPTAVGDVISSSFSTLPEKLENRCRAIVGESSWRRSQNWFKWILDVLPDAHEACDCIKYVEDRIDPKLRESKDCGSEPNNPAGLLFSRFKLILEKHGIKNKTYKEAGVYVTTEKG